MTDTTNDAMSIPDVTIMNPQQIVEYIGGMRTRHLNDPDSVSDAELANGVLALRAARAGNVLAAATRGKKAAAPALSMADLMAVGAKTTETPE